MIQVDPRCIISFTGANYRTEGKAGCYIEMHFKVKDKYQQPASKMKSCLIEFTCNFYIKMYKINRWYS